MLDNLVLGVTLLFLAAAWPPYNVYIAEALNNKDRRTVSMILAATVTGLGLGTALVVGGVSATNLPLVKLGGVVVLISGVRMLLSRPALKDSTAATKPKTGVDRGPIFTSFLISATPGVYALLAAQGITKHDLLQTVTVFVSGPTGCFVGGLLLAYGVRFVKMPMHLIGGVLVILISIKMIVS